MSVPSVIVEIPTLSASAGVSVKRLSANVKSASLFVISASNTTALSETLLRSRLPSESTVRTASHSFSAARSNVSPEPSRIVVVTSSVFNKPASTCLYSTSPMVNSSSASMLPISVIAPSAAVAVISPFVAVTASPSVGVTLATPPSAESRVTVPVFKVEPSVVASTVKDSPAEV